MDKDCFESFCTDAMLLIHEVVDYAASRPAERGEAEEGMLRQGRAVARALLVAIDQADQRRAMLPRDPVFARAVQEVRQAVSGTILSASSSRREIATPSHKEYHPTQQKGPVHPFLRGSGAGTSALCG
jgi:hypothetical protein